MSLLGDDCYFYCTSSCAKGPTCPFRHVESAKTAKIICQHWQMGNCLRPMCKFRHSDFKLQVDTSEIPCFWESQPTGCLKVNCLFKHLKNKSQGSTNPPVALNESEQPANDENKESSTSTVPTSINIPAETERNNSLPVKQVDQSETCEDEAKKEKLVRSDSGVTPNQDNPKKKKPVKKIPISTKPNIKTSKSENISLDLKAKKKNEPVGKRKVKKVVRPSVKERLGAPPSVQPAHQHSEGSDSESDSDDSIENIKVMSMEEIFRQKALESMMRKRAAEGKMNVDTNMTKKESSTNSSSIDVNTSSPKKKPAMAVKHTPPNKDTVQDTPDESESSSSLSTESESSATEEDTAEDFEPDIRRVVVENDSDKTEDRELSTKKLSINKKQPETLKASGKKQVPKRAKKRADNVDYNSDDLDSSRVKKPLVLNVRDRLGKSLPQLGELPVKPKKGLLSLSKRVVVADDPDQSSSKPSQDSGSAREPDLSAIKVKTLEEIKKEKLKKLAEEQQKGDLASFPVQQHTGEAPKLMKEIESGKRRRVLLSEEPQTDVTKVNEETKKKKRFKKFAQSYQKVSPSVALAPEKVLPKTSTTLTGDGDVSQPTHKVVELDMNKKHKHHRHKDRNVKKSKIERQIYIPPAMKNSSTDMQSKSNMKEPDVRIAVQRREPHPMAAVWTAGLSVSTKGAQRVDTNRSCVPQLVMDKRSIKERIGLETISTKNDSPVKEPKASSKASKQTEPSQVSIKSFSEIMLEKRRRRLELQTQLPDTSLSSNLKATSDLAEERNLSLSKDKPKVFIKPIIFDLDTNSSDEPKQKEDSVSNAATFKNLLDLTSQIDRKSTMPSKKNKSTSYSTINQPSPSSPLKITLTAQKKNVKLFRKKKISEQHPNDPENSLSESAITPVSVYLDSSLDATTQPKVIATTEDITLNQSLNSLPVKSSSLAVSSLNNVGSGPESHNSLSHSTEPLKKKSRLSIEDEFNFLEDENYDYDDAVTEDMEPIDDLLQNIDDLLS